jgi:hypothetical protein
VSGRVSSRGVRVVAAANPTALAELFREFVVVTLITHFKCAGSVRTTF